MSMYHTLLVICFLIMSTSLAPAHPVNLPSVQQGRYSGEPISLKLVEVSLVDFFRLISEVSGLNILIDPDVSGTVSLNMEQVPWDQLLDFVLQSHGLVRRIEGNLVRISSRRTLIRGLQARRELRQAREEAAGTVTLVRRLNYARASEIVPILEQQLSSKGAINFDERTNVLIITDIPNVIEQVVGLVRLHR